jgi:hypothetical protein
MEKHYSGDYYDRHDLDVQWFGNFHAAKTCYGRFQFKQRTTIFCTMLQVASGERVSPPFRSSYTAGQNGNGEPL